MFNFEFLMLNGGVPAALPAFVLIHPDVSQRRPFGFGVEWRLDIPTIFRVWN
jgi:hypothetical protein